MRWLVRCSRSVTRRWPALRVPVACRGSRSPVRRGHLACRGVLARRVLPVRPARPGSLAWAHQGQPAHRVRPGLPVLPVRQGRRVPLVLRGRRARRGVLARPGRPRRPGRSPTTASLTRARRTRPGRRTTRAVPARAPRQRRRRLHRRRRSGSSPTASAPEPYAPASSEVGAFRRVCFVMVERSTSPRQEAIGALPSTAARKLPPVAAAMRPRADSSPAAGASSCLTVLQKSAIK